MAVPAQYIHDDRRSRLSEPAPYAFFDPTSLPISISVFGPKILFEPVLLFLFSKVLTFLAPFNFHVIHTA